MFSIKAFSAAAAVFLLLLQTSLIQSAYIPVDSIVSSGSALSNDSNTTGMLVKRDITPDERARLDGLINSYKGIWWDEAYPGTGVDPDGSGECTVFSMPACFKTDTEANLICLRLENFDILAEATRIAINLASYHGIDALREDPWSHRFFVKNSVPPPGGKWTSTPNQAAYVGMNHNLLTASRFPVNGRGSGSRGFRVTYRCQDYNYPVPGTNGCRGGGVPAYTLQSSITGTGVTTIFCPLFFSAGRYLNDIAAGPAKTINDFGAPNLISYEQMIVHEWMHADVMKFSEHIGDSEDSLDPNDATPKVKIYGMSRCRDYAWKYMRDPCCPHINQETMRNADNYAWYFANKYYANLWNWIDDGTSFSGYDFNVASPTIGSPDNTTDVSSLPDPVWPPNCTSDPSPMVPDSVNVTINCVFDPPAPDLPVTVPQAPGTCSCNEDGCTPESPPCCGDGSC